MPKIVKDKFYYNIRAIFSLYILALIVSFLYVFITGGYNGDFTSYQVGVESPILVLIFVLSFVPFWYIWRKYKFYKKKSDNTVVVNTNFFRKVSLGFLLCRIVILLIGVGSLGQTTNLSWLKTIFTVLDPSLVVCIYIVSARKKSNIYVIACLYLIESILRHSLGGIFGLMLMFMFRYYQQIFAFCRKYALLTIAMAFFIPNVVAIGYNFRSHLRTGSELELQKDISAADVLCGALAGRLSSYSNTVYIIENIPYFYIHMSTLPPIFYQSLILNQFGIHIVSWNDVSTLEQFMFEVSRDGKREDDDTTTFMVSTVGMLLLSFLKSPWVFLLNAATICLIINVWFRLAMTLKINFAAELALFYLLAPIVSGVATELFFPIFQITVLYSVLFLYNGFSMSKHRMVG